MTKHVFLSFLRYVVGHSAVRCSPNSLRISCGQSWAVVIGMWRNVCVFRRRFPRRFPGDPGSRDKRPRYKRLRVDVRLLTCYYGFAFAAGCATPAEDYRGNVTIVIYTGPGRDVVVDLRAYKGWRRKKPKRGRGRRSTLLTTGKERATTTRRLRTAIRATLRLFNYHIRRAHRIGVTLTYTI